MRRRNGNLCEVYYDFYRSNCATAARDAMRDIFALGVQLRSDLSIDFWPMAGALKATVLTSDHHEFDPLAEVGVCSVTFIR